MGFGQSKKGAENSQFYTFSPTSPWQIIHSTSLDKWRKHAEEYGFQLLPSCHFKTERFANEISWNSDHCTDVSFTRETNSCQYQHHNWPPGAFSYDGNQFLMRLIADAAFKAVIPTTSELVALLFSLDSLSDATHYFIYIYDCNAKQQLYFILQKLGIFQIQQCEVSPDKTRVVVLVSAASSDNDKGAVRYDAQIYSRRPKAFDSNFQGNMFELEHEVPEISSYFDVPKLLFDPRHFSSKLALVNVTRVQQTVIQNYFAVYDLTNKNLLLRRNAAKDILTLSCQLVDARYSPDGAYVAAMVVWVEPGSTQKASRSIAMFDSDTCQVVHKIDFKSANLDECYVSFMPLFSRCATHVALRQKKSVKVYKLPFPNSLQGRCRAIVLRMFSAEQVERLIVPPRIKDYLQYKPQQQ